MKILDKEIPNTTIIIVLGLLLAWRIIKDNILLVVALSYLVYSEYGIHNESSNEPSYELSNELSNEPFIDYSDYDDLHRHNNMNTHFGGLKYDLKGRVINWRPIDYDLTKRRCSCCKY
jgi:hypothetical protein